MRERHLFEIAVTEGTDKVRCSIETEAFDVVADCIVMEMKRLPDFEGAMLHAFSNYKTN